jgi:hypothetical protein
LKSIKLRLDLTALYIAGECATFSNSFTDEGSVRLIHTVLCGRAVAVA